MTATATLTTDQLRQGDVVHTHGMRVLLDRPVENYEDRASTVYRAPGLVQNWAEFRGDSLIWGFLHDSEWAEGVGWRRVFTGRWTVQGNKLAHWTVTPSLDRPLSER